MQVGVLASRRTTSFAFRELTVFLFFSPVLALALCVSAQVESEDVAPEVVEVASELAPVEESTTQETTETAETTALPSTTAQSSSAAPTRGPVHPVGVAERCRHATRLRNNVCVARFLMYNVVVLSRQIARNVTSNFERSSVFHRVRAAVRQWRAVQLDILNEVRPMNETTRTWLGPALLNRQAFLTTPLSSSGFGIFVSYLVAGGLITVAAGVLVVLLWQKRTLVEKFWFLLAAEVLVTACVAIAFASLMLRPRLVASTDEAAAFALSYALVLCDTIVVVTVAYVLVAAVFSTLAPRKELPRWVGVATVCVLIGLGCYVVAMQVVARLSTDYVYDASELLLKSAGVAVTLALVVILAVVLRIVSRASASSNTVARLMVAGAAVICAVHIMQLVVTVWQELAVSAVLDEVDRIAVLLSFCTTCLAALVYVALSFWATIVRPNKEYAPLAEHEQEHDRLSVPLNYRL